MLSLKNTGARFETKFSVVEGGRGIVTGVIAEPDQGAQPSYVFVPPRLVLRTRVPTALRSGMVLQSPDGGIFLVGDNGASETVEGTLWNSFRLFEATDKVTWKRRTKVLDPVARIEREGPEQDMGLIWVALEVMDRPAVDLKIRQSFDQMRLIAAKEILTDDIVNGLKVTRTERQLGLSIGVLI